MTPGERKILGGFLALSLLLRLACIGLNAAEYTDGILQITAFKYGLTFWPPLYTVALQALAPLAGDPELAGKLVSVFAATLLLIPLYWTAHRFGGRRAAVYSALFYMVNPIAWRWSIRVMSDSLFSLLFFSSVVLLLCVLEPAAEGGDRPGEARVAALLGGSVLGALAVLTRLQGVLALALFAVVLAVSIKRSRRSLRNLAGFGLSLLAWFPAIAWTARLFSAHEAQVAERAGASFFRALLNYWNLAESFILLFPYFVTIPVFVIFAAGLALFLKGDRRRKLFAWTFLAVAAAIVGMQSVFSSFQSRYLLPLVPFMALFAGMAASRWEERAGKRTLARLRTVLTAVLLFSAVWTALILVLQRGAFGDIKQAARYCSSLPSGVRIFSNEWYRPDMPAIKMSFWSGRRIEGYDGSQHLAAGDYLCLHSAYGGLSRYPTLLPAVRLGEQMERLRSRYDFDEAAWFESRLVPLLPDIMENPDTHQNPVAWFYRYQPQRFRTVILRIKGPRKPR